MTCFCVFGPDAVAFHESGGGPIPFGTTGVALRPVYHMSAFLWTGVPAFDIRAASGQMADMLVRTPALGRALAQTLGARAVALMRGHVVSVSLPQVVFRSVYTEVNARLQAMVLSGNVTYLDPEEATKAEASVAGTVDRPWELWKRKARRCDGAARFSAGSGRRLVRRRAPGGISGII